MGEITDGTRDDAPLRVLFVCTANRWRSPFAEVVARDRFAAVGLDAVVASGGRLGGSFEASPGSVRAAARRGLDLGRHRSRPIDPTTLDVADLILVMERDHLYAVHDLNPPAMARSFTLREFPGLLARSRPSGSSSVSSVDRIREWIRSAHSLRHPDRVLVEDPSDDIADPTGKHGLAARRCARTIEALVGRVADAFAAVAAEDGVSSGTLSHDADVSASSLAPRSASSAS